MQQSGLIWKVEKSVFLDQVALTDGLLTVAALGMRRVFPRRKRLQCDPRLVKSILVVRLDGLGDVVMSTPMFRELKRQSPNARLTVVVRERCREIIETNPFVDKIIAIDTDSSTSHSGLISVLLLYWRILRGIRSMSSCTRGWERTRCTSLCLSHW